MIIQQYFCFYFAKAALKIGERDMESSLTKLGFNEELPFDIKNIRTKSLGSNNKQNVVFATIDALGQLKSPEEVAKLRGKSVEEILG